MDLSPWFISWTSHGFQSRSVVNVWNYHNFHIIRQIYDDTAEIGNPHGMTWIDKKLRESLNSQGTLGAYIIEKPRKGYLSLPFITYIIVTCKNVQFISNLKLSSKRKFILGESLPFIHTFSTNRYKHCDNPLLYFVPLNLWCVLIKEDILRHILICTLCV